MLHLGLDLETMTYQVCSSESFNFLRINTGVNHTKAE
uniref:Uncharacterized protein n=1 Tax=Arundo donax TaxID=35708 RepID=A0A0A9ALV1_ARUDO